MPSKRRGKPSPSSPRRGNPDRGLGGGGPGECSSSPARVGVRAAVVAALLALALQLLRYVPSSSRGALDVDAALEERHRRERENHGYDLRPTSGPRLVGLPLKIFARALRVPLLGDALVFQLMDGKNDYGWVRRLASTLDVGGEAVMPRYYPEVPLSKEDMDRHEEAAGGFDLGAFARVASGRVIAEEEDDGPFRHWAIDDYTSRYKSGALTPTDAIERVLAAIRQSNASGTAAFLYVNETDALEQAASSTDRYAANATLGPLDGVPLGVKDELDVRGYKSVYGTSFLAERKASASADSLPVSRARQGGMIIVGKTSMHEFGIGTTGHNPHHPGTPHNPYGPGTHYPGGSSSGSASAVASGLVPVALGADGGGSIRVPAALCGAVGLKPTYGRVPHPMTGSPSLGHVGPIANSVKDAALLYAAVAGPHEGLGMIRQPPPYITLRRNLAHTDKPLDGLRIGVYDSYFDDAEPNVVRACRSALDYFASRGAVLVPVKILHLEAIKMAHAVTILTEMSWARSPHWSDVSQFSLDSQVKMSLARSLTSRDFLAAQKVRAFVLSMMKAQFQRVDVIATPATAAVAPAIPPDAVEGGDSNVAETHMLMKYVTLGNLAGIPGIVFPVGYDDGDGGQGLPIGMQLMAWQWEEDVLFRTAKVAEGILPNGVRKPREYYDVLGVDWK